MKFKFFAALFFLMIAFAGCKFYSFTGASYGTAKTVTVNYFPNQAPLVNPTLSQAFTEKLKDKFVSQTPMTLVNKAGDLNFEGEIVGYDTKPMAIAAGETAASKRLTVTIHVKFTNSTDPTFNYDTQFSRYADYPNDKTLPEVEGQIVPEIIDQLIDDVFNKAVVNW